MYPQYLRRPEGGVGVVMSPDEIDWVVLPTCSDDGIARAERDAAFAARDISGPVELNCCVSDTCKDTWGGGG